MAFTDEELVAAWGRVDGIAAVARELRATYAAVNNRAMRLRTRGVPLRRMPVTPRGDVQVSRPQTAASCHVDPTELSELLEAYRLRRASDGSGT